MRHAFLRRTASYMGPVDNQPSRHACASRRRDIRLELRFWTRSPLTRILECNHLHLHELAGMPGPDSKDL